MTISVTVTLPESVIIKIDKKRGDVNRSKFILRLIEKAYQKKNWESNTFDRL